MTQEAATPVPTQSPAEGLADLIRNALDSVELEFSETATDVNVTVRPSDLLAVATALRDQPRLAFDFLRNVTGIDFEAEGMALKYHFYSFQHGHCVQLTVNTSAGHPHVPTLTGLYPTADWHEREASEMFGFMFDGHPNPRNLLLEEDLHIHPLLRAHPLQQVEILQGIEEGPPGFKF